MKHTLRGGNITYISPESCTHLVTTYWSRIRPDPVLDHHALFVGDVHGDLHQFLAPLVSTGIITLTGKIVPVHSQSKIPELTFYVPEYVINKRSHARVIYLGDMVDEWISTRAVLHMLLHLLTKVPNNVFYIYGNHDCNIVAQYPRFKNKTINFRDHLNAAYLALTHELSMFRKIHFYGFDKCEYNSDLKRGNELVYAYFEQIYTPLMEIFSKRMGSLSMHVVMAGTSYFVSHTIQNVMTVHKYITTPREPSSEKDMNISPSGCKPESTDVSTVVDILSVFMDSNHQFEQYKVQNTNLKRHQYAALSASLNHIFDSLSFNDLANNILAHSRHTKLIFMNQITGHTPGGSWREIGLNVKPSMFNHERVAKLTPEIINSKRVYYFDFNSSAGYDIAEVSRPDFVFLDNSNIFIPTIDGTTSTDVQYTSSDIRLAFSRLPSFNFIVSNNKDAMLICRDKSTRIGKKEEFSPDD